MARCTPQQNWTTRLRRHGGIGLLVEKRARQFQALARVSEFSRRFQQAREAMVWLEASPLRVLNSVEERVFRVSKVSV